MHSMTRHKESILQNGFTVIENIYTQEEITELSKIIDNANPSNDTFRKSTDLFAIRQFFKEVADAKTIIFNDLLKSVINSLFGDDYFVVKSIYFDKPEKSNWFVSYHQDLTISVNKKVDLQGYSGWTHKQNQFAVQPPVNILESIFTIRIHLDDTDGHNGALKIIPSSHSNGVQRIDDTDFAIKEEQICSVPAGGIMIMRPLLFHASNRTTNNKRRRVIHIEFSNQCLPEGILWSEAS